MNHQGGVMAVAFSPDGRTVLTRCADGTVRLWEVSKLPDDPGRIATWVQVITGLELDETSSVSMLDNSSWRRRREKLETQGGPPATGARGSFDPIIFGPEPTARARAWSERGRWTEAEAAFDEAVAARPLDAAVLLERARFLADHAQGRRAEDDFARAYLLDHESREPALLDAIASRETLFRRVVAESPGSAAPLWDRRGEYLATRGLWSEAAAAIGEASRLKPEETYHRHQQILLLLAAGDRAGVRRVRTDLLDRFRRTTNPREAESVAWASMMTWCEEPELGEAVRLAEFAINREPGIWSAWTALGAALYRAGRFAEAVRRLEEGIQKRNGRSVEADWVFLAMAHHRLGHRAAARRWLDRLREHQPSTDPHQFWNELEMRLLRSEAEAVILFDPVFPADPFVP
jgi:tetratricopeptide (TPR) repeat protein